MTVTARLRADAGAEDLEEHANGGGGRRRFELLTLQDLEHLPDPEWLIDGVLPNTGAAMLYGAPGEGKSFLALDWALSIAGWASQWQERSVLNPGPVVYVAAEGLATMKRRVRAWLQANAGAPISSIRFVGEAVQLLDLADARGLVRAIKEASDEMPALVVLDTLARCMVGADENLVKDVSRAIASVDAIREATGGAVLLVHHSQKGGDLERGSSALRAAMDVMLSLKAEDGVLTLESTKVKDGPPLERISLVLQPVGDSCVIASALSSPAPVGLTRKQREALQALASCAIDGGASGNAWMETSAIPRRSFFRLVKQLADGGYIQKKKGVGYTLTITGEAAVCQVPTRCQPSAMTPEVPSASECHTPVGGGTKSGTGTHPLRGDAWEPREELPR